MKTRTDFAAVMLAAVMLAEVMFSTVGCSPRIERPDLGIAVPSEWTASEVEGESTRPDWWLEFDDERLDAIVAEALGANHDIGAAEARLSAAIAQARIDGAGVLPRVGAGFNAAREKSVFVGLPIPGGGDVLVNRFNRVGLSLDTSWEVDLWGRVRAQKSAAIADSEAAAADLAATRVSIAGQAAKAWFAVVEARMLHELARSTLESWRLSSERVRARFDSGVRSALDLRLSLSSLARAESAVHRARLELDLRMRQLETLLGRYPAAALEAADDLPTVPDAAPGGLPSTLLERRADIAAAERRLAAANERIRQARASLLPRISLTASVGTTSDKIEDLTSRSFSVWSLAGNIVQPLFESGRLIAGVDLAEARERELLERYAATVLTAFREVESALATEVALSDRVVALERDVEQAAKAEELALDRYLSGLEDFLTVLESQRRTAQARADLITTRRQRLDARADLYLALGGGFERQERPRQ